MAVFAVFVELTVNFLEPKKHVVSESLFREHFWKQSYLWVLPRVKKGTVKIHVSMLMAGWKHQWSFFFFFKHGIKLKTHRKPKKI